MKTLISLAIFIAGIFFVSSKLTMPKFPEPDPYLSVNPAQTDTSIYYKRHEIGLIQTELRLLLIDKDSIGKTEIPDI